MGSGDKHHYLNFHIHIPHVHFHQHHHHHHHHGSSGRSHIPKGCLAIFVGQGEERQRFIIPIMYMNHPLFMQLLKEAEEEYGFEHSGPINIPCHVKEFIYIQGLIDQDISHHHHQHHLNSWCFRA